MLYEQYLKSREGFLQIEAVLIHAWTRTIAIVENKKKNMEDISSRLERFPSVFVRQSTRNANQNSTFPIHDFISVV